MLSDENESRTHCNLTFGSPFLLMESEGGGNRCQIGPRIMRRRAETVLSGSDLESESDFDSFVR